LRLQSARAAVVALADGFQAEGKRPRSAKAMPERRAARGAQISASRQQGAAPLRHCERYGAIDHPTGARQ
jgi:hypothetical protein